MKCVSTEEGKEILQEIHEGMCGNHAASHTLVGRCFDLISIGQLLWQMPKHLFAGVLTASSLANSPMFWLITSSLYHPHGRLHAGGWTR
jgi:hypothetical protein